LAGIVAYRVRCANRFAYGVVEIVAAFGLMVIAAFHPGPVLLAATQGSIFAKFLSTALSYVTSVYLMVRGLDNMSEDLPPAWQAKWDRFFPKQRRQRRL
jgi:hypothetical protein